MENRVCELEEIGRRLEASFDGKRESPRATLSRCGLKLSATSVYAWINGESQGGYRDFAVLSLALDRTPDQLLLDRPRCNVFNEHDCAALVEIEAILADLTGQREWRGARPAQIAANHLREIRDAVGRQFAAQAAPAAPSNTGEGARVTIPPGTVIARPEPGVKTMVPPPQTANSKLETRNSKPRKRGRKIA